MERYHPSSSGLPGSLNKNYLKNPADLRVLLSKRVITNDAPSRHIFTYIVLSFSLPIFNMNDSFSMIQK